MEIFHKSSPSFLYKTEKYIENKKKYTANSKRTKVKGVWFQPFPSFSLVSSCRSIWSHRKDSDPILPQTSSATNRTEKQWKTSIILFIYWINQCSKTSLEHWIPPRILWTIHVGLVTCWGVIRHVRSHSKGEALQQKTLMVGYIYYTALYFHTVLQICSRKLIVDLKPRGYIE